MKIATARYHSNIPEGAVIYGKFTQPFGADVGYDDAWERLAVIIENNVPLSDSDWIGCIAEDLAYELLIGLDFPNDGCEITFYLYTTEE